MIDLFYGQNIMPQSGIGNGDHLNDTVVHRLRGFIVTEIIQFSQQYYVVIIEIVHWTCFAYFIKWVPGR